MTKPLCDLAGTYHDPEAIKRRIIRALDAAGCHWEATDFFVRSYDNHSPNGLMQAARQLVDFSDWQHWDRHD